jgi:enoyl-[acyl-carrier protein] reductase III
MTHQPFISKVALVTGSSRGIGRAIALRLAAEGADIVVHYLRKKSAAEAVVAEIEALGRRAIAIKANLAEVGQIEAMFDRLEAEFGRCDIFIGNAASGSPQDIMGVTDKQWDWTMDVNARAILRCAQRAAPLMAARGWGRMVLISSPGSQRVLPHYAVIGLSKAVVEAMTRYLAADLARQGIIVNAVSPGLVNTEAVSAFPVDLQAVFDVAASRAPAGRLVTPEDVAGVTAFLCSEAAGMIVGQTLTVDGGYQLLI